MNKIAVTTVSLDKRYTEHLDLVIKAWERVGYKLAVVFVTDGDSNIPLDAKVLEKLYAYNIVSLPTEAYNSPFKATYIQSLRFWAVSNLFKHEQHLLVTDADILPIDKKHFDFELAEGEIMHLNATPYVRFDKPQLPACYYGASYHTFHKYFPRIGNPIDWLIEYLHGKKEVGRDEYWASKYIEHAGEIRARVIDCRLGGERYKAYDEGKNITPKRKVIDFHFAHAQNIEETYNKLVENSDAQR